MKHSELGDLKWSPIQACDFPALLSLENKLNPSPWSEQNFFHSLRAHHLCFGLQRHSQWLAYCICSRVLDEAELLLLGVAPEVQRLGLASAMLTKLCSELLQNTRTLFLEVRASNKAAIALYENSGFSCTGRRPNYYPGKDGSEDALLFAREIFAE